MFQRVRSREELEAQKPYTHRFYYEPVDPSREFWNATPEEQQPILRAISLSRLVKPTSIAYSNVWIKSSYRANGRITHFSEPVVGAYSVAYGLPEHGLNTITESDASHMAMLWDSFSFFSTTSRVIDGSFEP